MPNACVLLANGFEEIEAVTIIDVLRRAEISVAVLAVGTSELRVEGSHAIVVEADRPLREALNDAWDVVILPGGLPGAHNLRDDPEVQTLVKAQHQSGKRVAAICAAPIALGAAGILAGKRATSYPGFEDELTGATCVTDRVVCDGNVVTSRGPGTALPFALEIVSQLRGDDLASTLRNQMLVTT